MEWVLKQNKKSFSVNTSRTNKFEDAYFTKRPTISKMQCRSNSGQHVLRFTDYRRSPRYVIMEYSLGPYIIKDNTLQENKQNAIFTINS